MDEYDQWAERARSCGRPVGVRAVRLARHDRLRGSRSQRHVERRSRLRSRVDRPRTSPPTGRRIATAAGRGSSLTDGRGSTMRRGASRPSTTAAGHTCATAGCGRRAPCVVAPCMRLRSSCSLAADDFATRVGMRVGDVGVVPARAERGLSSRVSHERPLRASRERHQRARHQHQRDEHQRHEHQLSQSAT